MGKRPYQLALPPGGGGRALGHDGGREERCGISCNDATSACFVSAASRSGTGAGRAASAAAAGAAMAGAAAGPRAGGA